MAEKLVVIVGGSLAGVTTALSIRDAGFTGDIRIVEAGAQLPPDRPALSKQVLTSNDDPALYRGAERLGETNITVDLAMRAVALDAANRRLDIEDLAGNRVGLEPDYLVLATGSVARSLPASMMDGLTPGAGGVFTIRDGADALGLRSAVAATTGRIVVIGAGFIGAEVAASLRSLDRDVTMIEAAPQPLDRVLPAQLGETIAALHRSHGVDVRVGIGITSLVADGDDDDRHVTGVALASGEQIACDVVVLGVGAGPDLDWLRSSGLHGFVEDTATVLPNGLQANAFCELENQIFAVGDVLSWPHPKLEQRLRIEQWENAINSGAYVGKRIAALAAIENIDDPEDADSVHAHDLSEPYGELPWFWSDQYDRKLQMVGLPDRADEIFVIDGALADFRFVAMLRRGDQCSGVIAMNRPRHIVMARNQMNNSLDWLDMCEALGVEDPAIRNAPTTDAADTTATTATDSTDAADNVVATDTTDSTKGLN